MKKTIKDTDTRTINQNQKANPKQKYLSPTTSPLKVSKLLWNSLTPKSRRKVKLKLKGTDTPAGLSHQF